MILLKLILRNIFAHKLRNIIIYFIITFVVFILFIFLSFSDGEIENFKKGLLGLNMPEANIVVKARGFLEAKNAYEKQEDMINRTIKNYPEIIAELKKIDFIKDVYVKTNSLEEDIFYNNNKYRSFMISGVEGGNSPHVTSRIKIIEGRYITDSDVNVILLHSELKKDLNLNIGDTISVVGNDVFGQSVAQDFKLIGYFKPLYDNPNLYRYSYVDIKGYANISGYYKGETNTINIDLKKNYPVKKAQKYLDEIAMEKNFDIEFDQFNSVNQYNEDIYGAFRFIIIFISLIIVLIVMFGIMNIVSVNLNDRKREIGSYYCLGAGKSFLIWMYSFEILIVNIFSSISGILLGLFFRFIINSMNITTEDTGLQIVFASDKFYLGVSSSTILWILLGVIIITILTALTGLKSALKVSPSVAVREVE